VTVYELVNPHDPYHFDAPDDDIAEAVAALLGGMYGWQTVNVDPERSGGFGDIIGAQAQDVLIEKVKAVLNDRPSELAAALRSLGIEREKRERLGVDPEAWHDEMRSSAADPRTVALHMAEKLDRPQEPAS
jgi:hypothetical protein